MFQNFCECSVVELTNGAPACRPGPSLEADISRAAFQIRMLTGGSVQTYAKDLIARYLDSGSDDTSIFEEEVMTLSDLQARLRATAAGVLQEYGPVGQQYADIDARCEEMNRVILFIEDIYMVAITNGARAVGKAYERSQFLFQKYSE